MQIPMSTLRAGAVFCATVMGSCAPLPSEPGDLAPASAPALADVPASEAARGDVLTQRSDNGRTGATVDDAITPRALRDGSWQLLGQLAVDGPIYAQPLYVQGQLMADGRAHDVVYVATAKNKLYAFDASTLALLWRQDSLEGPDPSDNTLPDGCRALVPLSVSPSWESHPSDDRIVYGSGILSTPVIDRSAGAHGFMYFTYRTGGVLPSSARQWIARVDLATGAIGPSDRQDLSHFIPKGGSDLLDESSRVAGVRQRPALLLSRGMIYVAFGARCEAALVTSPAFPYRGSVLAVDASTLGVAGVFVGGPTNTVGVGIWQGASGLAADDRGDLYFMTGNAWASDARGRNVGLPEDSRPDLVANAFVRLSPQVQTGASGRTVSFVGASGPGTAADFFSPYRTRWHNEGDLDLGASGVMLPPNTGVALGAGKEGVLYVLDRANLGGQVPGYQLSSKCAPNPLQHGCHDPNDPCAVPDSTISEPHVLQHFQVGYNVDCPHPTMSNWMLWPHVHGTPVYGRVGAQEYLYVWPEKGQIKAYPRVVADGFRLAETPHVGDAITPLEGMPGAMMSLSTTSSHDQGVLFAALPLDPDASQAMRGGLLAFDATPADGALKLLWADYLNDQTVASSGTDRSPRNYFHAKFVPPTIAHGRVFLPTFSNQLRVYGPGDKPQTLRTPAVTSGPLLASASAVAVDASGRMASFDAVSRPWTRRQSTRAAGAFPVDAPVAIDTGDGALSAFAVGTDQRLHAVTFRSGAVDDVPVGSDLYPAGAHVAARREDDGLHVYAVNQAGALTSWSRASSKAAFQGGVLPGAAPAPAPRFPPGAGVAADSFRSPDGTRRSVIVAVDAAGRLRVHSGPSSGPYTVGFPLNLTLMPGAQLATAHAHTSSLMPDVLHVLAIAGAGPGAAVEADMPDVMLSSENAQITTGSLLVATTQDLDVWEVSSLQRSGNAPGVPGGAVSAVTEATSLLHVFFAAQDGRVQEYTKLHPTTSWTRSDMLSAPAGMGAPLFALPGTPVRARIDALSTVQLTVSVPSGTYGLTLDALPSPWRAL